MEISSYDVNVQLALATTAEHDGDLSTARAFLTEARRLAPDHLTRARVHWATARFFARRLALPALHPLAT
ncbi:MAG TPA: hypothetical protein VGM88_11440 [Kofleriaceae bacterium]|jgi:hypothetical protein